MTGEWPGDRLVTIANEFARKDLSKRGFGPRKVRETPPDPEWDKFVDAYVAAAEVTKDGRPSQEDVAYQMGLTERQLHDRLHGRGVTDYRSVHRLIRSGERPQKPAE